MSDQIIYIVILEGGDVFAFRKKEDAEAEADEGAVIHEAYLQ